MLTAVLLALAAVQPTDPPAPAEPPRFLHDDSIQAVAFAPDGRTLASAGIDRSIRLWQTATGELLRTVGRHDGRVLALTFSPDGKLLASTSSDLKVHLWDPAAGKLVRTLLGHTDTIQAVAFSPDGKTLATASLDQTIRLWDAATGRVFRVIEYVEESAPALAFTGDGKELLVGFNPSPHLRGYDVLSGKAVRGAEVHRNGDLTRVAVADRFVVATTASGILLRLDLAGALPPERTAAGTHGCLALAASPDGKLLLVGGPQGDLDLVETATLRPIRRFTCQTAGFHVLDQKPTGRTNLRVRTVGFSATGAFLVAGNEEGYLRVWRLLDLLPPRPFTASRLTDKELAADWEALSGPDAEPAYLALARLGAYPEQSLPFLAGKLQPAVAVAEQQVRAWIAQLDHDDFDTREQAYLALRGVRQTAAPLLREALASKKLPLGAARRVEELLEPLDRATPEEERLRAQRLVLLLQVVGTAEAEKLLEKLASGEPASPTTRDARATLERLRRLRAGR